MKNLRIKWIHRVALCGLYLLLPNVSYAILDDDPYARLRDKFVTAEQLVWKHNSDDFQQLSAELVNYPLHVYLQQAQLLYRLNYSKRAEIEAFLDEHDGQPVTYALRDKWLDYLQRHQKVDAFIAAYRENGNSKRQCYYLRLRLQKGMPERELYPYVQQLWLSGQSQPKICDPLFSLWAAAGNRSDELVWQRLILAATKGKSTLIPYLKSLLPEDEQYLADLFLAVRRSPSMVSKINRFVKRDDKESVIASYGLTRLIWRDRDLALSSFNKLDKILAFTPEQRDDIAYSFALGLATNGHPQAKEWLYKVSDKRLNSIIVQWRITDSVREQNWPMLLQTLNELPPAFQQTELSQYWLARALDGVGRNEEALALMQTLARQRHYYGFLASSQLQQAPSYQNTPLLLEEAIADSIKQMPAFQRAHQFFLLDRKTQARREWNYAIAEMNQAQQQHAARMAFDLGWFDRAIFGLAASGYPDDVEARFPLAHATDIEHYAKQEDIDPSWAYAIARRESSFMPDANSHAGAVGLMQLLPSTASALERGKVSRYELMKPKRNIRLGTRYLKFLLDKQDGNPILATASYNAGYVRVNRWKPDEPMPADIWIETIPYKETREYVKSVLAYQQIYLNLRGKDIHLFDELIDMEISR